MKLTRTAGRQKDESESSSPPHSEQKTHPDSPDFSFKKKKGKRKTPTSLIVIELVKYLLTSPELKVKPDINAQSDLALTCACQIGSLEIVKYLIESPELENHSKVPFINNSPNNPIIISAKNKKLDVLEYLVSISENKDKDLFSYINNALSTASLSGDIDMVNFLLKFSEEKSNKEKDSIYLEASLTRVIQSALISDKIDLAEYILNSPKFSPYIDLHQNDDYLFNSLVAKANLNNTFETLHYLIFELNIPQTNSIIKIIKDYPCPEVEKMFSLRELHKDLKKDLNFNITDQKKIKI